MERKVIQVEERPPLLLNIPLSIQHLFAISVCNVWRNCPRPISLQRKSYYLPVYERYWYITLSVSH